MIRILYLSLLLSFNYAFSQTTVQSFQYVGNELQYIFTSTYATAADHSSNSASPTSTKISVSALPAGYFLKEVIVILGDGSTGNSGSLSTVGGDMLDIKIKDPNNIITNVSNNVKYTNAVFKNTSISFRNNSDLKTLLTTYNGVGIPLEEKLGGIFKSISPWSITVGNNDWYILTSLTNNSGRKIKGAKLIFGNSNLTQAITAGKNCGNAVDIQNNILYTSTNNGCDVNQAQYPPIPDSYVTNWNGARNTTAWFSFIATNTNAKIRVNSINPSKLMQSIVAYTSSGSCSGTGSDYTLKGSKSHGGSSNIRTRFNYEYEFIDLVVGKKYFLLIDGDGSAGSNGDISEFTILLEMIRPTALPIELISFSAIQENEKVNLNWSTASERNNDYFTISRSSDLENWEEVGTVKGSGSINYKQDYNFTDIAPLDGVSYYRLQQTDYNGENESFDPVSVEINANRLENALVVYPNPTKAGFDVQVYAKSMNLATVSVHNVAGKSVINQTVQLEKGKNMVPMKNEKLEQGVYVVKIQFEDGTACLTKLVVD